MKSLLAIALFLSLSFICAQPFDDVVFTTEPACASTKKCIANNAPFTVVVTSYLPGTTTVDTSVNNVQFFLRWSDATGLSIGSAYLVDATDPTMTTKNGGNIVTTAHNGVATFQIYVVGGSSSGLYQLMSSDMADPKLCHEGYSCQFNICQTGGFGDPQFVGLQGQQFQVHGRPDTLFKLISYPSHGFALNSEFVYLAEGTCDYNNTVCWTHPGTYFGKMGMLLDNSTRVLVNSGSHKQGLQVYINDKRVKASDNAILFGASSLHVVDFDSVEVRTKDFFITLVNSDSFLNMDLVLLDKVLLQNGKKSDALDSDLHGLLGQTWRLKEYSSNTGVKRPYKGTTDDYIVDSPFEFIHS